MICIQCTYGRYFVCGRVRGWRSCKHWVVTWRWLMTSVSTQWQQCASFSPAPIWRLCFTIHNSLWSVRLTLCWLVVHIFQMQVCCHFIAVIVVVSFSALTLLVEWWERRLVHKTTYSYFNDLRLNPSKSGAVLLGTCQCLLSFPTVPTVNIASSPVTVTDQIKTLGIIVDKHLTFGSHVSALCQKSVFHLRALRHIRSFLTEDMAASIASAMVLSCLDYSNSLLFGCSADSKYCCPDCFDHTMTVPFPAVSTPLAPATYLFPYQV